MSTTNNIAMATTVVSGEDVCKMNDELMFCFWSGVYHGDYEWMHADMVAKGLWDNFTAQENQFRTALRFLASMLSCYGFRTRAKAAAASSNSTLAITL